MNTSTEHCVYKKIHVAKQVRSFIIVLVTYLVIDSSPSLILLTLKLKFQSVA